MNDKSFFCSYCASGSPLYAGTVFHVAETGQGAVDFACPFAVHDDALERAAKLIEEPFPGEGHTAIGRKMAETANAHARAIRALKIRKPEPPVFKNATGVIPKVSMPEPLDLAVVMLAGLDHAIKASCAHCLMGEVPAGGEWHVMQVFSGKMKVRCPAIGFHALKAMLLNTIKTPTPSAESRDDSKA